MLDRVTNDERRDRVALERRLNVEIGRAEQAEHQLKRLDSVVADNAAMKQAIEASNAALVDCQDDVEHQIACHADQLPETARALAAAVVALEIVHEWVERLERDAANADSPVVLVVRPETSTKTETAPDAQPDAPLDR